METGKKLLVSDRQLGGEVAFSEIEPEKDTKKNGWQ